MRLLELDKRYLQIAFNYDMALAERVIPTLPRSDRILIEAGTPFIKRYGEQAVFALGAAMIRDCAALRR